MPGVVAGVEELRGVVRRSRYHAKPVTIPLDGAACRFLLVRLADVTATTEAIIHHPSPGQMISPWSRSSVVGHVRRWVDILRALPPHVLVISLIDRAIVVQAIEGNPYFARMADDDPRLTIEAVRAANAVRERFRAALRMPIGRISLGSGRRRIDAVEGCSPAGARMV